MAKKRKLESEPSQPPLQIEEEEENFAEEEGDPEEIVGYGSEEVEYEEVEYEEEEEEVEEEVEEDDPHNDGDDAVEPSLNANHGGDDGDRIQTNNDGGDDGSDASEPTQSSNDGDEDESIQSVLAAFSKETLITLLSEAAERHNDVAARVWASAEVDQSMRKIFVHGLKWDTTSETLFLEFVKYGEIEDCRVIINKATGRSKGYGFVLFKTCRAARLALKEPHKLISGRMTSSQLASVGPVVAALPQNPQQSEYTQRKIFVSNVGEELDPEKLMDFFSKFGDIEEGPLGLDKETGRPKGFCLFTYKTVESAKLALAEPHKQFEGVTLHCQQAIDGPKHQKSVSKNLHFIDNVASGAVDSTIVPPYMHLPPPMVQQPYPQPQPLNVDPAAVGHALTTLLTAQGGGLNLLGALGAIGAATGMLNNPAMVPSFGGPVVQGGYGMNMGSNGMEGCWNQGRFPAEQRRRRGRGRGQHGPRPYMGQ